MALGDGARIAEGLLDGAFGTLVERVTELLVVAFCDFWLLVASPFDRR